ncbi:MAG: Cd(II)/Pb(II)-responsive transcriptional regulator [Rubrivivax sp.]|nr:MAG: Cd(II)/Pb(II)-responsive transcriptional regulator [Rubrivivax sp.]
MRIGELARLTGTPVDTIRHYEREGLLLPPPRTDAGYRVYGPADAERLHFIRRCRSLDMNLAEVRALLALQSGNDCAQTNALLDEHIGHVSARIAALQELEKELLALRARCQGDGDACAILESLAEPGAELPPKSHVGHSHQ